jgi:hypothetical protein
LIVWTFVLFLPKTKPKLDVLRQVFLWKDTPDQEWLSFSAISEFKNKLDTSHEPAWVTISFPKALTKWDMVALVFEWYLYFHCGRKRCTECKISAFHTYTTSAGQTQRLPSIQNLLNAPGVFLLHTYMILHDFKKSASYRMGAPPPRSSRHEYGWQSCAASSSQNSICYNGCDASSFPSLEANISGTWLFYHLLWIETPINWMYKPTVRVAYLKDWLWDA